MTYHHDIVKVLAESDEPLTAEEIHEKVGGHRTKIYSLLKRMRQKNKVIADRSKTDKGVFIYQLRKQKV